MKKQIIISLCLALMALFATPALAQNQKVTGTVVDDKGEPIIGASVMVVGEKGKGTVTDFDGNYALDMPANGKVTISYIGYISQTVKPGGTVQLKEDSQSLEEVVVVGYGVQKMKNVTGAVTTVDTREMADLSTGSLGESLQGLVNGLGVSTGSRPGESSSLTIRQAKVSVGSGSTVESNASPLYVIDDFISTEEAFNNLDASVIDQISVLKDASAAVYGARAANGVILVKTKRGQNSAPKVTYSGQFGWTGKVKSTKMVSAFDYARLYNGVVGAMPTGSKVNNYDRLKDVFQADELAAMQGLDYDLVDKYWKTAFTHKHNVNVSGGSDRATYFAGIGYFDQDGNLGNIDYHRWNYRAGADVKLGKWFKTSLQISGDIGDKKNTYNKISGNSTSDYYSLMSRPRYIPDYLGDRPMSMLGPSNNVDSDWQNYNYEALQRLGNYTENHSSNMTINTSIEHDFGWYEPLKGLKLKFTYSRAENNNKTNQIGTKLITYKMVNRGGSGNHLYSGDMSSSNFSSIETPNGNMLYRGSTNSHNYQMNLTLSYNRKFGDHDIGAVFSIEKSEAESENVWGQVSDPLSITNGQSKTANGDMSTAFARSESGTLSYIGRINYAYMDKYLFEFLLRTDASTKFAPENYWGTFPSVSAGWVMSEENWFKKTFPWIDFFKIRASFGLLGRDNIQPWKWLQYYNVDRGTGALFGTGTSISRGLGVQMSDAPNRDAHWDKSYKWNGGIDARFLGGRLSVGIDAYYEAMREILISRSQSATYPGTVGTKPSAENYGAVNLWGVELSLGWRDQIGKDFKYHVKLNTGYSDNEVKEWFLSNDTYYSQHLGERMLESQWGLQCLGMFRSYQEIEEYFTQYNITKYLNMTKDQVRPGMLIYKDVRGERQADGTYAAPDGVVDTENDLVCMQNRNNPYAITLNLGGEWKNLSFSAQLHATWGGYSYIDTYARGAKNIRSTSTSYGATMLGYTNVPSFWANDMFVYEDVLDANQNVVCPANRGAYYPNMAYNINSYNSTFWRVSGTRITLRNITVAYTLPKDLVKKIGLSSVRFNLTGQNMLSLYNPYPDNFIDPMDTYGAYPALRKVTLGVNIGF
ncbi:MAG: TonB-dependent receptor [Prevotella sp.]|nr:TonB-dependent receptor [Prevotella sp.]